MKIYHRENYLKRIRGFYHDTSLIKVITEIRRCGKSCLMQAIAEELKGTGVPTENIVYINLGFYFATNTDNRINYGPVLENITYIYSRAKGYSVSVGRI